jgi:hypothetical protein
MDWCSIVRCWLPEWLKRLLWYRVFGFVLALFFFLCVVIFTVSASAAPTPKGQTGSVLFDVSKVDLSKISDADMRKTLEHREQLFREQQANFDQQQQHIVDQDLALVRASDANAESILALASYAKQVGELAAHDKKMTDALNACSKKLWWYRLHWWGAWIAFALGIVACIILAILKVTGRLSFAAAKVASKL